MQLEIVPNGKKTTIYRQKQMFLYLHEVVFPLIEEWCFFQNYNGNIFSAFTGHMIHLPVGIGSLGSKFEQIILDPQVFLKLRPITSQKSLIRGLSHERGT